MDVHSFVSWPPQAVSHSDGDEEEDRGESAKPQTPQKKVECESCSNESELDSHSDEEEVSDFGSDNSFNIFDSIKAELVDDVSKGDEDSDAYESSSEEEPLSKRHQTRSKTPAVKAKKTRFAKDRQETRSIVGKLLPSPVSVSSTPCKSKKRKAQGMESTSCHSPSKAAKRQKFDVDRERTIGFFKSSGYCPDLVGDLVEEGFGPNELIVLRGLSKETIARQLERLGNILPVQVNYLAQALTSAKNKDWQKLDD